MIGEMVGDVVVIAASFTSFVVVLYRTFGRTLLSMKLTRSAESAAWGRRVNRVIGLRPTTEVEQ